MKNKDCLRALAAYYSGGKSEDFELIGITQDFCTYFSEDRGKIIVAESGTWTREGAIGYGFRHPVSLAFIRGYLGEGRKPLLLSRRRAYNAGRRLASEEDNLLED